MANYPSFRVRVKSGRDAGTPRPRSFVQDIPAHTQGPAESLLNVICQQPVEWVALMPGQVGEAGDAEQGLQEAQKPDVQLASIGNRRLAVSADDSAAGRGEPGTRPIGGGRSAGDTAEQFRQVAGFSQQIQRECQERLFPAAGGQLRENGGELVEQVLMGVVFLDQPAGKLGGIEAQVQGTQRLAQAQVSLVEMPFGKRGKVSGGVVGEDRAAEVQEVDAAVKAAGAGLGAAMSPFGDGANDAVLAGEKGQDLRGFAVLGLEEADTAVVSKRHRALFYATERWRGESWVVRVMDTVGMGLD